MVGAMVAGILTDVSDVHVANASSPMLVTVLDSPSPANAVQPWNAPTPITPTMSGMTMLSRDVHPRNANRSMIVTDVGMVIVARELQNANAYVHQRSVTRILPQAQRLT